MQIEAVVAYESTEQLEEDQASIRDTALVRAWRPDEGKTEGAVVVDGIALRNGS